MPITSDTVQFVARLFAVTVAAVVLLIVLTDIISVFYFGDGEGLKIVAQLNGPLIAAVGSLTAAGTGHQLLSGILGYQTSKPVAAPPVGTSNLVSDRSGV